MASTSFSNQTGGPTRLQEEAEKRKASEHLNQKREMKRRKQMFAPRKVIGPRDILVNSKIPKIKLEDDAGCSSSSVKQEYLEAESANLGNFSEIDDFIQPWTLGTEINEETNEQNLSEISKESEGSKLSQNHIKLLKVLANLKDQEIKVLKNLKRGLKHQLHNDDEVDDEQIGLDESNSRSTDSRLVTKIVSDLTKKDAKIKAISMEMLALQNEVFGTKGNSLQMDKRSSRKIVQKSFKLVLPFLYTELQLNDLLTCRCVCQAWRESTDTFLNTQQSLLPFDREIHTEEQRKLELGRIPTWNVSPLEKLAKAYKFSDLQSLDNFSNNRRFQIVGSNVCLDNILLEDLNNVKIPARFCKTFGIHIKYLTIRQNVELPDFKIQLLMDRVKLCLCELPYLKTFTLVFCIDADKIQKENGWDTLKATGNAEYENWHVSNFPKLERLESLKIEVDITEGWTVNAGFLWKCSKSLIRPYSNQLKQLSIFAHGIGPEYSLEVPNLVQLTIPRRYFRKKVELGCEHVEKCTVTSSPCILIPNDILNFERLFPKLICLGIKFEYAGGTISELEWTPFAPKLEGLKTLELENCGGVTFTILCCFPNLRFIRLINKYANKSEESAEDTVLNITQLWKGRSLYESKLFWEHFPNISLVTLEFSGNPVTELDSKICTWTRNGYRKFLKDERESLNN